MQIQLTSMKQIQVNYSLTLKIILETYIIETVKETTNHSVTSIISNDDGLITTTAEEMSETITEIAQYSIEHEVSNDITRELLPESDTIDQAKDVDAGFENEYINTGHDAETEIQEDITKESIAKERRLLRKESFQVVETTEIIESQPLFNENSFQVSSEDHEKLMLNAMLPAIKLAARSGYPMSARSESFEALPLVNINISS